MFTRHYCSHILITWNRPDSRSASTVFTKSVCSVVTRSTRMLLSTIICWYTRSHFPLCCLHRSNAEESYHLAKYQQTENSTTTAASRPDLALYLGIYGGLVVGLFFLSLFSIELYYTLTVVASKTLYDEMLSSLMRAPMYFFDNNSIGERTLT